MKPKELARLAIDAVGRGDQEELNIINDSVEIRTYECQHKDYQFFLNGFELLCMYYGKEYWKMNACLFRLLLAKPYTDEICEGISKTSKPQTLGTTKATNRVLKVCKTFCEKHKK